MEGGNRKLGKMLQFDYGDHWVRCGGTKDYPYFVAQDLCDILGIKNASSALAEFPENEKGIETIYTNGVRRDFLVVYEPGLYRLIFRSNKPEAEVFRRWVFHEVLPAIRKTGEYKSKKKEQYAKLGHSPEWIEQREQGIEVRKDFTSTLKMHGISEGWHFGKCTNAIYDPILGGGATEVKKKRHLPVKANLRDNLSIKEILQVSLSEVVAQEKMDNENRHGFAQCFDACKEASTAIAMATNSRRQIS